MFFKLRALSAKQPAALIELGFLSKDDTIEVSPKYRNNAAQGIYLGIIEFFQSK
jgi:N-acetylmuramoyl-L-alanine amidase